MEEALVLNAKHGKFDWVDAVSWRCEMLKYH